MNKRLNLTVSPCTWQEQHKALTEIRKVVFIEEQNVPIELEWDGEDETSGHIIAEVEGIPVGTARLLASGQIGRMSVLKDYRRLGIGKKLLNSAEELAINKGIFEVFLHAQTYIQHFYAAQGYAPQGEEFMDAGIPHIEMKKSLA